MARRPAPVVVAPRAEPSRAVVRLVPRKVARVDRLERWRTAGKFGDLSMPSLLSYLDKAERGDVADWADLCEYMIHSDELVSSLYETRVARVVQADWIVSPAQHGDQELAELAVRLCDTLLDRVDNVTDMMRFILHALAPGFSFSELDWAPRPKSEGGHYVRHVEFIHGHRFRFDEQWQPRFYDRGMRPGADGYGEHLQPFGWLQHIRRVQAGYPGIAGIMRTCAVRWLFRRWAAKWEIQNLEVHGRPLTYAEVGPNTPEDVRDQILTDLENLSADHFGVVEAGTKLIVEARGAAEGGHETFRNFADATKTDLVTAWLGFSDAVDPGTHGSQSAIEGRAGLTADPRMVADGAVIGDVIRSQLFRAFIYFNSHEFGLSPAESHKVPVPEFRFKTAGDEVEVDEQDDAEERGLEDDAPRPGREETRPRTQDVQQMATAALAIAERVASGALPRESAKAILTAAFSVDDATADRMVPAEPLARSVPEPHALSQRPPPKSKSPLALALRGRL